MKKLNLKNIKGRLSKDEMKQVQGGCGNTICSGFCSSDSVCGSGCSCCYDSYFGTYVCTPN